MRYCPYWKLSILAAALSLGAPAVAKAEEG